MVTGLMVINCQPVNTITYFHLHRQRYKDQSCILHDLYFCYYLPFGLGCGTFVR